MWGCVNAEVFMMKLYFYKNADVSVNIICTHLYWSESVMYGNI